MVTVKNPVIDYKYREDKIIEELKKNPPRKTARKKKAS